MTSLREAAQQALVCVVCVRDMAVHPDERMRDMAVHPDSVQMFENTITALRTALAEPEQEPVAWKDTTYGNLHHQNFGGCIPLYTHPPQRKPLTDEEIRDIAKQYALGLAFPYDGPTTPELFARAIERAHGIGGDA
jgi:hypothetical protein